VYKYSYVIVLSVNDGVLVDKAYIVLNIELYFVSYCVRNVSNNDSPIIECELIELPSPFEKLRDLRLARIIGFKYVNMSFNLSSKEIH
jgi:hypothetical protein